jgi:hypothetical protein
MTAFQLCGSLARCRVATHHAVLLVLFLAGCSSFQEKHYFRVVDKRGKVINYFRLTVDGGTAFCSSRYVSGYFDEQAVNEYFGTIAQPKQGAFGVVAPKDDEAASDTTETSSEVRADNHASGAGSKATATQPEDAPTGSAGAGQPAAVKPVAAKPDGTALILLLSSNADAIAEQLGALAESKETLAAVTALANKGKLDSANSAKASVDEARVQGGQLQSLGDQFIAGLPDDADRATAEQKLLAYLNVIAQEFGNDQPFASLDDASKWINAKRAVLIQR